MFCFRGSIVTAFYTHIMIMLTFCVLLCADKNLRTLEIKVNAELSKTYDWLIANELSLNLKILTLLFFDQDKRS